MSIPRLRLVLIANALSCAAFGALFAIAPSGVSAAVGDPPAWLLQALGVVLLLNAAHLLVTARKSRIARSEALYFALGDGVWVVATAALIVGGLWITTAAGVVGAAAVAIFVGACGALQWRFAPQD